MFTQILYTHTRGDILHTQTFREKQEQNNQDSQSQASRKTPRKMEKRLHNSISPVLDRGVPVRRIWQRRRARMDKGKTVITNIHFRFQNDDTSAADEKYADIGTSEDTGRWWAQV